MRSLIWGICLALVTSVTAQSRPTNYTVYTFNQLVDHYPNSTRYTPHVPSRQTFPQRYVLDTSYYRPGGPIFLTLGGEAPIVGSYGVLKTGALQIFMQAFGGAGIILENRYYGTSLPFNSTSTDELRYHTTEQMIADNAYFARNVRLPGVGDGAKANAPARPWIVYGGSLAGGQAAFTMKAHGDVFYGGIASSGLTVGQLAYPAWYNPVQRYAPQDCISSINTIISNFDTLIQTKTAPAIAHFKSLFGLESLPDIRDFAATIGFPLGGPFVYPTKTWQEINWNPDHGSQGFWEFCRNVTDLDAPKSVVAVDYTFANLTEGRPWTNLGNYAAYVRKYVLPLCPSGDYNDNTNCFGTQNKSYWADPTPGFKRSYLYTTCTEMGYYQAAPAEGPTLISRLIDVNYTQEWCNWAFPDGKYNKVSPNGPDLNWYNRYGGNDLSADRLAFISGSADVWRDSGYHSEYAPMRYEQDPLHPQLLINGGGHCWDYVGVGDVAAEPQFIREAHLWEIRVLTRWLRDFSSWKPAKSSF